MQTKAVIRAAFDVKKAHADWNVPEIMIPLVGGMKLKYVKKAVVQQQVLKSQQQVLN